MILSQEQQEQQQEQEQEPSPKIYINEIWCAALL